MRITAEFESLAEFQAFLEQKGIEPPKAAVAKENTAPETAKEPDAEAEPETTKEPDAEAEPPAAEPPEEPSTISLDKIQKAGAQLLSKDKGKKAAVRELFKAYGIKSLQDLIPSQYNAFAEDLIGLGATL
jgi:hypothetical protein